jgi:hypothetical protein
VTEIESTPVQVTQCSQTVDSVALNTLRSATYTCPSAGNSTLTISFKAKLPLLATITFTDSHNATTLLYNVTGLSPGGNFPSVVDGTYRIHLQLLQTSVNKVTGTIMVYGEEIQDVDVPTTVYPYRPYGAASVVAGVLLLLVCYLDAVRPDLLRKLPGRG